MSTASQPWYCGHDVVLTPLLKLCHECLMEEMRRVADKKAAEEALYFPNKKEAE